MKVYVVTAARYEDLGVLGVYSSRESALTAIRSVRGDEPFSDPRTDGLGAVMVTGASAFYAIEEVEVDSPPDRYTVWGITGADPGVDR